MLAGRRKAVMDKLLEDIKVKQKNMIELGLKTGLTSSETIRLSQELDMVILEYQCHKEKMDKASKLVFRIKDANIVRKFTPSKTVMQSLIGVMIKL